LPSLAAKPQHISRNDLASPSRQKEHGHEPPPTTETSVMPFSAVLAHGRFKFQARDQLQNV